MPAAAFNLSAPTVVMNGVAIAADPSVVRVNGEYLMFYTDLNYEGVATAISAARSSDGVTWTRIMAPGDQGGSVLSGAYSFETADAVMINGELFLYVSEYDEAAAGGLGASIYAYRVNPDFSVEPVGSGPVISPEAGGADEDAAFSPTVFAYGGGYVMYYVGHDYFENDSTGVSLLYATSNDGVTWTRGAEPVLRPEDGPAWSAHGFAEPSVVIGPDGRVHLFYTALDGENRSIGYAVADHPGGAFEFAPTPLLTAADCPGSPTQILAPSAIMEDGELRLWFFAHDDVGGYRILNSRSDRSANELYGYDGNDTINGGAANDFLSGGTGNDVLTGGTGDDWIDAGTDSVDGAEGNDLIVIRGAEGQSDRMNGGSGADTIRIDAAGGAVTLIGTAMISGIEVFDGSGQVVRGTSAANVLDFSIFATVTGVARIEGLGGNDSIIGTSGRDVMDGGEGHDTLDGGLGNDTMIGGAGNDRYVVDAAGDRVFETTTTTSTIDAGGIDMVLSAVTFDLDASAGVRFVERLTLTGTGNINGIGNALANILTGNAGNNVLNGGEGDDLLSGESGNDVLNGENGSDGIYGGDGNDTIDGGADSDLVGGGSGNDSIFGGLGDDTIYGGPGDDTVSGGAGSDVIFGSTGRNRLLGDDGNDQITASAGGDFIGGGAGIDTIRGGEGADTIYAGLDNDNIGGGAGNDLIFGSAGSNFIWAGLGNDTVQGGSGSDTIYGSAGQNQLLGNDGNDLIYASAGGDFIGGGAGNDSIFGSDGADTIFAGLGNDFIGGGAGNDLIVAGTGANRIFGGLGNDTIVAGSGRDVMTGEPGADVFVFNAAASIGIGAGRDVITDFTSGVDDIDLRALGTTFNGTVGVLGGGEASFFYFAPGGLLIGDQDGDGVADWVLELTGAPAVTVGDFML